MENILWLKLMVSIPLFRGVNDGGGLMKIPLFCYISNPVSGCFLSPCDLWLSVELLQTCHYIYSRQINNTSAWPNHWPISVDIPLNEPSREIFNSEHGKTLHWGSHHTERGWWGVMGSGGSKKGSLDANYNSNRRPSQHELTNPPTECRGGSYPPSHSNKVCPLL